MHSATCRDTAASMVVTRELFFKSCACVRACVRACERERERERESEVSDSVPHINIDSDTQKY